MKRMLQKLFPLLACLLVSYGFTVHRSFGQVSYTGTYSQDFDGIGTTTSLPTGWSHNAGAASGTGGSATLTQVQSSTLSGTASGGAYNFCNPSATSNRAVGFLNSGSFTSARTLYFAFTNGTGSTISSLNVSYCYGKYRDGSRAFDMNFFHGNGSSYTNVTAGNQNYGSGSNAGLNPATYIRKTFTLTGISIASGATYYFAWTLTGSGGSTNGQGIGVDSFTITPTTCSGTPTAGTVAAATNPICASGTSALSVTGSSTNSDLTFQWQSSSDSSSWSDISGQTNATYTTAAITTATYYRRKTTCPTSSSSVFTPGLKINYSNPSVSVTPITDSICFGGSGAALTASNSYSGAVTIYTWAPTVGLSSSTGASVTANPTVTTTYTVTGTQSGCTSRATAAITYFFVPAGTITGARTVAIGDTIILNNSVSGGVWTISDSSIAVIASGNVAGISGGTAIITYTVDNGICTNSDTALVSVCPSATATFTDTALAVTCRNTDVTYTTQSGQSLYVWTVTGTAGVDYSITSGAFSAASNTVTLKWLTPGTKTVTVRYCGSRFADTSITFVPEAPAIAGIRFVVPTDSTRTLTNDSLGGVWTSSDTLRATVNAATGVVTGLSYGNVIITYTVTVMGCSVMDTFLMSVSTPPVFYSKSSGALDSLTTWGNATDGSGLNPISFTEAGKTFNIRNGNPANIFGTTWTVSGTGSKVVLDSNNMVLPAAKTLTATVDLNANSTFRIQKTTPLPTLGTMDSTSTVIYNNGTTNSPSANIYGSIRYVGANTSPLNGGTINLRGNLTFDSTNVISTASVPVVTSRPLTITVPAGTAAALGNAVTLGYLSAGQNVVNIKGNGTWDGTTGIYGGVFGLSSATATKTGRTILGDTSGTNSVRLSFTSASSLYDSVGYNEIIVNKFSQLLLSLGGTYNSTNASITLNGIGNPVTLAMGGALVFSASSTWNGCIVLASNSIINTGFQSPTINGVISGPGMFYRYGTGNMTLNGANTYSGGTFFGDYWPGAGGTGQLTIGSAGSLGSGEFIYNKDTTGSSFLNLNNAAQTLNNLRTRWKVATGSALMNIVVSAANTLTLNQTIDTVYGTGRLATHTASITGVGRVVKAGPATLTLSSPGHTFSGGLTINEGILRMAPSPLHISPSVNMGSCPVTLNGGTFSTFGASRNTTINFNTLRLDSTSFIALDDTGNTRINFANSSAVAWGAGDSLKITGWEGGYDGTSGTNSKIFFGSAITHLTTGQLNQIVFINDTGTQFPAILLSTGELVPSQICTGAPTPGTVSTPTTAYCGSASPVLTLVGSTNAPGIAYQWQSSNDSISWTNISGATNLSYTPTITDTTFFRAIVTCTLSGLLDSTGGVSIIVKPAPPSSVIWSASGANIIYRGTTLLLSDTTVTGFTTAWSSSSTGVASVNSSTGLVSGVAAGSANISYTLTNSIGCSTPAVFPVVVRYPCATRTTTSSFMRATFATTGSGAIVNTSHTTSGGIYDNQFANKGIVALPGATVNYTFTNSSTFSATYNATLYIDWNQSGTFSDSTSELALNAVSIAMGGTYSGTFTVPTTARSGKTLMRAVVGESCGGCGTLFTNPCGGASGNEYGNVIDFYVQIPDIVTSTTAIAYGNVNLGDDSTDQYYLSSHGLYPDTGRILITPPSSEFLVSADNSTFSSSITKAYGTIGVGDLARTPIYVKYAPLSRTASGAVGNSATNANTKNVNVSGNGGGFFLSPTRIDFGDVAVASTRTDSITFYGQNLSGSGSVAVSSTDSRFEVSLSSATGFGSSVAVPFSGGSLTTMPTKVYVRFNPGALGSFSGNINFSGGGFSATDTVLGNGSTPCVAPVARPTSISFPTIATTTAQVAFTLASGVDSYLVVRSLSPISDTPVNGVFYPVGAAMGSAVSAGVFDGSPATISGLVANTGYYVAVFPFNFVGCSGGPTYKVDSPLSGNFTTCIPIPGTPSLSSITSSGFNINWSASAGAVSYDIDVATDSTFSSPIAGSPFTVSTTSSSVSGLSMNVVYYVRVRANGSTCVSSPTQFRSARTLCVNPTVTTSRGTELTICLGASDTLTVRGADSAGAYTWAPTTGVSTTGAFASLSPTLTTTYSVTGTNRFGCNTALSYTAIVNTSAVGLSVTPTADTLCAAGSQLLQVAGSAPTIISNNFNGDVFANGWVTTGALPWSSFSSGLVFSSSTINSFDGSRFYGLNLLAYGAPTNSILTSPTFSLAGLSSASAAFYEYYNNNSLSGEYARFEISTNGGSTWTTLQNFTNDGFGGTRTLSLVTISLNAYVGQTNCKIRFNFNTPYSGSGTASFIWTIDQPSITGTAAPTWSPAGGLYTNAAATTSYTGAGSSSVYAAYYDTASSVQNTYTASMGSCPIGTNVTNIRPDTFSLTGVSGCNDSGVVFGLNSSQRNVSYQLLLDSTTADTTVIGTGAAISFGRKFALGTYSVRATTAAGCTLMMSGRPTIGIRSIIANLTGGSACSSTGITLGLDSSSSGVSYDLYRNGVVVDTLLGTGAAVSFGFIDTIGVYTVVGRNLACSVNMNGSDTVFVSPNPYSLTGGDGCSSTGIILGLSGSQSAISYQLYNSGIAEGALFVGTDSALVIDTFTATGAYYVVATATRGCTVTLNDTSVINASPIAYTVAGGSACSATGITVGLSNSQTGVSYQLYNGASPEGFAVAGTGAAISFGSHTEGGVYTVVGSYLSGCQTTMMGADTIYVTPSLVVGATPGICQPATVGVQSYSTAVGSPTLYNIAWDAAATTAGFIDVAAATLGGSVALNTPDSIAGSYSGSLTVSNAYCTSSPYAVSINIYTQPVAAITSANAPCIGATGNITVTGTPGATFTYRVGTGSLITETIPGGGVYNIVTSATSGTRNYTLYEAYNPACANIYDTTITITPIPMVWIGGTTGAEQDWNNATNWSCGFVPSATDNVYIPFTTYAPAVASAATANTASLTIDSGVVVTIGSSALLSVKGNFNNTGKVIGDGAMMMNGTSSQSVSGLGTVRALEIDNASGVIIDSASRLTIDSVLTVTSGSFTTNDSLVLSADSSLTSRLAPLGTSASIVGKVKVMVGIQGGLRRYRFWGHPFVDMIPYSQMQNYIDVTGTRGATNGFRTTATNAPSAFRYNTLTGNSGFSYDPGWKPITSALPTAADTNQIKRYQGVRVYIRGAKGEGLGYTPYTPSAVAIGQWGNLNQGRLVVSLLRGATDSQDYNLLGNPYASPVDIGTVLHNAKVAGNIYGSFYIWNPTIGAGGQFQSFPISTVSATPYYLAAGTAFEVRAVHNGDSLVFNESNKGNAPTADLLRTVPEYTTLSIYDANYHLWDMLRVKFDENATDKQDMTNDAGKIIAGDLNFYAVSAEGKRQSIDVRAYNDDKVIPLGITSNVAQQFIITAESVVLPANGKLFLHDKLMNKYVALEQATEYPFIISKDASSQGDGRFELVMKPATNTLSNSFSVVMAPNPASQDVKLTFTNTVKEEVNIRLADINGVTVYSKALGSQQNGDVTIPLTKFAPGIYLVELTSGDRKVTRRLVKE